MQIMIKFLKKILNPNTKDYWDKLYNQELENVKIRQDESVLKLIDILDIKERIMDFGSGPGGNTKLLSEKLTNKKFFLVDHSKTALDFAKKSYLGETDENKNQFYYYQNISDLNDQKVDAIITLQVLEHISNYKEIIDQLWDKLDKNGVLIISVPVKGIRDRHREHINKFTVKSMFAILTEYSDWVNISPRTYSSRSKILSTAFFSVIKK